MKNSHRSGIAAALLLSACGGGGTDGGPTGPAPIPAPNRAPVITSPASAETREGAADGAYTVTATDADGDALSYFIFGGDDADVFDIDRNSGVVTPKDLLDFETPADADGDNVYAITVEARDTGGLLARQDVALSVTNVAEAMTLKRVGQGFSQPLYLTGLPGTPNVLVVELGGKVRVLDPETGIIDSVDFLDVSADVSTGGERGLLGLVLSPDFETDRTFYVNLTDANGDTEVRRYQTLSGSPEQADPATADLIFTLAQPASNHNSGWLGFSNDGLLYVPTGDGGGGGDPLDAAQDTSNLLGKILRLDVSSDDFPGDPDRDYAIPPGNAFVSSADGLPEIYAIGLRNPFRCSVDSVTGDLFIGDVGQNAIEEINRLGPNAGGTNYGWDEREGTQQFEGPDQTAFSNPVAEYSHGAGNFEGRSITGGYIYRGNIEPLKDRYVFADFVSGNVWSIAESDLVNGATVASSAFTRHNDELVPDEGALAQISSFGLDDSGQLYILSLGGDVFRVEGAP